MAHVFHLPVRVCVCVCVYLLFFFHHHHHHHFEDDEKKNESPLVGTYSQLNSCAPGGIHQGEALHLLRILKFRVGKGKKNVFSLSRCLAVSHDLIDDEGGGTHTHTRQSLWHHPPVYSFNLFSLLSSLILPSAKGEKSRKNHTQNMKHHSRVDDFILPFSSSSETEEEEEEEEEACVRSPPLIIFYVHQQQQQQQWRRSVCVILLKRESSP